MSFSGLAARASNCDDPAVSHASITGLERHFAAAARMRGERYFRQGRVLLRRLDAGAIAAEVRGTRRYDVSLRFDEKSHAWEIACTCEAFASIGPCKHLWATLQAARAAKEAGASPEPEQSTVRSSFASARPRARRPTAPHRDGAEKTFLFRRRRGYAEEEVAWYEDDERRGPRRPLAPAPDGVREPWAIPLGQLRALVSRPDVPSGDARITGRRLRYVLAIARAPGGKSAVVEVGWQRAYKRGGWSEPRPFQIRDREDSLDVPADDRAIVALLRGASGEGLWTYGSASSFGIPTALQPLLLSRMAATGRLHLSVEGELRPDPLAWDSGAPWEFGIAISRKRDGGLRVEGFLSRGADRMPLETPVAVMPGGIVVTDGGLSEADWRGAWECVSVLRRSGCIQVPKQRAREVLDLVRRIPGDPLLEAPGVLREMEGPPRPRLLLDAPDGVEAARAVSADIVGRVEFEYETERVGRREPSRLRLEGDALVRVRRDEAAEQAAIERLAALGVRIEDVEGRDRDVTLMAGNLPALVTSLTAEGWYVEAEGRPCRGAGSLRLSIRSGIDWFDLEGAADFGGASATLPDLLRAVEDGVRMVRLSDGSFGILPEAWLAGWGLAGVATEREGRLRFQKSLAWLLDLMLAERGEVDVDAAFDRARTALRRFERFEPAREPEDFRGELRGYQREGLGWLQHLRDLGLGGCLADDMGLGKTVQVLALLAGRPGGQPRPSLVVAPRSVVFNWLQEARRFAPGLSVLSHHGPGRAREEAEIAGYDLVVTTYGTLRRDVELLSRVRFEHAILDEGQMIKNAASQSAKAARLLSADHRLVLTGTPVENHLDDLWSIFEFLNPGMLGRSKVFRDLVAPARGAKSGGLGDEEGGGNAALSSAGSTRALARALRPFLLRRTKEQVLKELPPKIEQVVACDLEGSERRRYEELRDHYRAALLSRVDEEGMERIRMHVLEALLRLRQAACHPGLIDPARVAESSAKLDALMPMLEEVRESGHKALVFSQFTSFLAIVRERLDAAGVPYEYLDGRTRKREEKVRRFQEDRGCPLFLISLKAGGFGLNLAAADYVFLLDPWWNPAVERQAIDRTHRIGQTRTVNAYRLVARDTIEEKVLELQERKRELAEAILGEAEGTLRDLTREDLEKLLS